MKKIALIIALFFLLFPSNINAEPSSFWIDCGNAQVDENVVCGKANTQCLLGCSLVASVARNDCLGACGDTSTACMQKASANYKICIEKGKQTATPPSISTKPERVDCWRKHMQITGCLPKFAECLGACPKKTGDPAAQICATACGKESSDCTDRALANYRACENTNKQGQAASETKKLELTSGTLEQNLENIAKTQKTIDECPPPRVPSESACVSDALSKFGLPDYLKDVVIETDFTDVIVLDSSKMQVISLPDGIKSAPDYMRNTISSNFDYLKEEFAIDESQLPIINLLPVNVPEERMPEQSYSIVESEGLSSVAVVPSKTELNRSGYYGSWQPLVVLDKDANSIVSVGGPAVSNATKMALDSNAKVTLLDRDNKSVMEISKGAKVVVAGMAADDTIEAAQDFISKLKNLDDK